MGSITCLECGAGLSDGAVTCPVCGASLRARASERLAAARRVLKGDALRAVGAAAGILGIVVLLEEGSPTLGMAALGLGIALYIVGSVRA